MKSPDSSENGLAMLAESRKKLLQAIMSAPVSGLIKRDRILKYLREHSFIKPSRTLTEHSGKKKPHKGR